VQTLRAESKTWHEIAQHVEELRKQGQ
jgi:hypothetical protein